MQVIIESILCNLIQTYMNLPNDYGTTSSGDVIPCVVISGQDINLFNTPNLQVTVQTISNNIYSTYNEFNETADGYTDTVYSNEQRTMQIDIYSRNTEALMRYPEVQLALRSTLAEQLQEQYNFKISSISQAINNSGMEGGSEINRYTIRFDVIIWHTKTTNIDYYDTFGTTYQTNNKDVVTLNLENPYGLNSN